MNKTTQEWAKVSAEAVTSGSTAQATNVLQMALEDIAALATMEATIARIWKALGIETYEQAHGKEISEIVAALRASRIGHVGIEYPNDALTDVCKQLLDDWCLSPEQITNLAQDLPDECTAITENRSEAYWTDRSAPDDSSYRRDIINAGRGHLLK